MSEKLFATVKCPLCGGIHENPNCFYLDPENVNGLQIICPALSGSTGELHFFPFKELAPSQLNPQDRVLRVIGGRVG